jgi:hypothetical protein
MKQSEIPANWGRRYTKAETQKLRHLFRRNRTQKHIAAVLGRSEKGIHDKLHRMGLRRQKIGRPRLRLPGQEKLRKMLATGLSQHELARRFHCDRKTISYRLGTWRPQRFPSYPHKVQDAQ